MNAISTEKANAYVDLGAHTPAKWERRNLNVQGVLGSWHESEMFLVACAGCRKHYSSLSRWNLER